MDKRKSVVKTLRLLESSARSLEREAADEGTSVNAIANSIISDHFEWHKKAEEFGFAAIPKTLLKSMLEGLDEEALARIGRKVVPSLWREMGEFWFQDSTPDAALRFQLMRSKFNPDNQLNVTREKGMYTVVYHHDFGLRWSIVMKSALQEYVKQSYHVEPRISSGESVVTARFKVG